MQRYDEACITIDACTSLYLTHRMINFCCFTNGVSAMEMYIILNLALYLLEYC